MLGPAAAGCVCGGEGISDCSRPSCAKGGYGWGSRFSGLVGGILVGHGLTSSPELGLTHDCLCAS